jgi:hypothetical protein
VNPNTPAVKEYLRLLAKRLIDDDEEAGEDMGAVWGRMTPAERDTANELVSGIFIEWV